MVVLFGQLYIFLDGCFEWFVNAVFGFREYEMLCGRVS
jgi:hypothetical protein